MSHAGRRAKVTQAPFSIPYLPFREPDGDRTVSRKEPKYSGSIRPSKKNAKNDEYQLLERRKKVAQLYCEGKSQFEIARIVGVTQSCVSKDLTVVRKAWLATAILDWDDVKAKELAKLDVIEERMWEAYHKSYGKEQQRTINVRKELRNVQTGNSGRPCEPVPSEDDDGALSPPVLTVVEETQNVRERDAAGNQAYMTTILECIKLRCKILGFLDDKNVVNNNVNVNQINWDEVVKMSREAIEANDPVEARIRGVLSAAKDRVDRTAELAVDKLMTSPKVQIAVPVTEGE